MERRLQELSPELHRRFTDAVIALQSYLSKYQAVFPYFTDHSELHSLSVLEFCNRLIGDQIGQLNADEIYALLAACYFHDTGMGISADHYAEFSQKIDFGDYFERHALRGHEDVQAVIRDYHNEFSGLFVKKYASFFEIPSDAHVFAIVQIVRGHRATDLMDPGEYPVCLQIPGGNTICLPYLTALIRLADEIDVSASRNPVLLYDMEALTDEKDIIEFGKHNAIRTVGVSGDAFTLTVDYEDPAIAGHIAGLARKMQATLDTCRRAVNDRTPFRITQERVEICKNGFN